MADPAQNSEIEIGKAADSSNAPGDIDLEKSPAETSRMSDPTALKDSPKQESHVSASEANKEEKSAGAEKKGEIEKVEEKEVPEDKAPPMPRTRIGRPNKNDKQDIIDQAEWQTMVPKKDPESNFVMAVNDGDDGREQVTLYSPYIHKVFRAVIR